uniref:SHSP domain-containing protein n=1 Tax=Poecilia mexicana TaxID=48701 RepID=A0A3B3X1F0_9TELE
MDSRLPLVHSWTSPGLFAVCGQRSDLCSTSSMSCRETYRSCAAVCSQILEDTEPFRSSVALQPVSYQLDKEGEHFGLTLDTQGFSPEDLSVRQVGRKLRVSGTTEKKQEDGKGSYSYSLQEFRQEFDLPEGVNHEDVSCHLSPDGKLHIQAAKVPCIEGTERELTIKRSSEEEPQQSVCSQEKDSRGPLCKSSLQTELK